MQFLSNEEYLDYEEFWKDRYEIKFIKVNENGTDWWQVVDKLNPYKRISCTSMLAAFKIAHTAMERKMRIKLSTDNKNILRKTARLLGYPITMEEEMIRYARYIPEKGWIDDKEDRENFKEYYLGYK